MEKPTSISNPTKPDPDPIPSSNDATTRIPGSPPRASAHRRAHSEILTLPDDISFDTDLGFVGGSDEPDDDLFSMYLDIDKLSAATPPPETKVDPERPRVRHQHSQSMDGSTSIDSELLGAGAEGDPSSLAETKKVMSAAKLADLALVDPKRAKRIWANRQSAARSKERKMRYIAELERKVQTLQTEATTLSAQLTMLQRDTTGLTAENGELKLRLQTMEQQVHLQDALNDALREEVQRLKMATGQVLINGGSNLNYGSSSFGGNQPFYPQTHAVQSMLATHQLQQLHLHSNQQQLHSNSIQYQQLQQQQSSPQIPYDIKSKAPMFKLNQSQRENIFEANT